MEPMGQGRHPGVKVHTFAVMVWFISKCMKFLPGDRLVRRSLDLWNFEKTSAEGDAECVWAVSVYTVYYIFILLLLVIELKVSLLK